MQGAVQMGNIVERAELAIAAGCDMVLVCNDPKGAVKVIDGLPSDTRLHQDSVDRIKRLRKTTSVDFFNLKKTTEHLVASKVLEQFYAN
jgi:beta-N-acetylhexosaminidase